MIHKLQVLIILAIIPLGALYFYTQKTGTPLSELVTPGSPVVHLGDIPIRVKVADTPALRERGLSGLDELPGVGGMLFIFDKSGYHGVWMKDMRFPIDVIWVDEDLTIIDISENLWPDSYPQVYEPSKPALYAIETDIGFAEAFGIRVGQTIILPLKYR